MTTDIEITLERIRDHFEQTIYARHPLHQDQVAEMLLAGPTEKAPLLTYTALLKTIGMDYTQFVIFHYHFRHLMRCFYRQDKQLVEGLVLELLRVMPAQGNRMYNYHRHLSMITTYASQFEYQEDKVESIRYGIELPIAATHRRPGLSHVDPAKIISRDAGVWSTMPNALALVKILDHTRQKLSGLLMGEVPAGEVNGWGNLQLALYTIDAWREITEEYELEDKYIARTGTDSEHDQSNDSPPADCPTRKAVIFISDIKRAARETSQLKNQEPQL